MHDFFLSDNSEISYLFIATLLRKELRQLHADLVQLVDLGRLVGRIKAESPPQNLMRMPLCVVLSFPHLSL